MDYHKKFESLPPPLNNLPRIPSALAGLGKNLLAITGVFASSDGALRNTIDSMDAEAMATMAAMESVEPLLSAEEQANVARERARQTVHMFLRHKLLGDGSYEDISLDLKAAVDGLPEGDSLETIGLTPEERRLMRRFASFE